jgi:hypothetical protein
MSAARSVYWCMEEQDEGQPTSDYGWTPTRGKRSAAERSRWWIVDRMITPRAAGCGG